MSFFEIGTDCKKIPKPHEFERRFHGAAGRNQNQPSVLIAGAFVESNQQTDSGAVDEFDLTQVQQAVLRFQKSFFAQRGVAMHRFAFKDGGVTYANRFSRAKPCAPERTCLIAENATLPITPLPRAVLLEEAAIVQSGSGSALSIISGRRWAKIRSR